MDLNGVLNKFDRIVAWLLLALFLLMMVSGYMLTKGFIDRYWGFVAHMQLAIPAMALFTIHFAIRIRFMLLRWKMKNVPLVNLVSVLVGLALFLPVLYLGLFFP
jgi:cytochrome b subunit of formate dehydrogenase